MSSEELVIENVVSDLQKYVDTAMDIQMDHDRLTHVKGITVESGNKLRTCVSSMIKIIIEQQNLISKVIGENEVLKSTRIPQKKTYAETVKIRDVLDHDQGEEQKIRV